MLSSARIPRRHRMAVAVLVILALAMAAGCSRSGGDRKPPVNPPSATSSVTPSVNAEEAAARAAALAAYNGYREAYIKAAATADADSTELTKYTADPLLAELKNDLKIKRDQGLVTTGRPVWNAQVTTTNVTVRPFTIQLDDCFDATNWPTVYKANGKPAGVPGQNKKYHVTAEATLYDDGRWLINSARAERERPC